MSARSTIQPSPTRARNPCAAASLVIALAPFAVFAVVLATAGPDRTTSDTADRILYASVPICGVLALASGVAARRRSRNRVVGTTGLVLGAIEVLASIAVLVGLAEAFRTLGMT